MKSSNKCLIAKIVWVIYGANTNSATCWQFDLMHAHADLFQLFFLFLQIWSSAPMRWMWTSLSWQTHCLKEQPTPAGSWYSNPSSPHNTWWSTATRSASPHTGTLASPLISIHWWNVYKLNSGILIHTLYLGLFTSLSRVATAE